MPQSPDQQRAIVQRMIDAGESEANIATVIQHFQKTATKVTHPLATVGDAVVGAGKRVVDTAVGLGELVHKIPGVSTLTDALYGLPSGASRASFTQAHQELAPTSTAQKVGGVAADIGTALVPGGQVTRLAQGAAKLAPRGLGIASRAAVEGAGQAAIAGAQGYDPTLAGAVGAGAGVASGAVRAVRGALKNPNAVEREALEYAASKGVPVDAATMSGNASLKGAKYLADKSLAGSLVAGKELQKESKGLATLGEHLAARTGQRPQTVLTAGESLKSAVSQRSNALTTEATEAINYRADQLSKRVYPSAKSALSSADDVRAALTNRIKALHEVASENYSALREMEAANVQRVITGSGPSKTGVVRAVTQTEEMGFPVQLRPVKAALKPIYLRLQRQMPVTQQQASAGFKALENIVNGSDIAPASLVDADLSAIKSIARGADQPELRDLSQGLAAKAVRELSDAVDRAVERGGIQATNALATGRAATKAKYVTADILDSLNDEPVKAYRQATSAADASIVQLRELAAEVPKEIPKIGRAVIDDLMAEGRSVGWQSAATKWAKLGPETRKVLFKEPKLRREVDEFFALARNVDQQPIGRSWNADALEALRTEPAQAMRQLTQPKDASIAMLRDVARFAPKEIPKLGRAYLDDALDKATSEGGFKGAVSLANNWQSLGPETKKILFPQAGLVPELDKFFIAAKRLAENPNPSGTSGVVSIGAQGGLLVFDPVLFGATQATGAITSKLLRNPTVVRLLTQGMKAPKNSLTAQALKQAVIRTLNGRDE